jgi:hypothetical protein
LTALLPLPVEPEGDETGQRLEPETRRLDTRHQQPFEPFEPDTRFASALVEFGSWHVLV